MKQYMIIAVVLAAVFSVSALAGTEEARQTAQQECKGYAMEEGISEEQLEDYIAECVQDLMAAQSEGESQPSEGVSQE